MFAGSFDPPTLGHMDIVKRASVLFDHLHVVIAVNPEKRCLFSVEERRQLLLQLTSSLENVTVHTWGGYSVEFARQNDIGVMIRGMRSENDYNYEYSMACMNRRLLPGIETLIVPAEPQYSEISSSLIKRYAKAGRNIENLVPPEVVLKMTEKLKLLT